MKNSKCNQKLNIVAALPLILLIISIILLAICIYRIWLSGWNQQTIIVLNLTTHYIHWFIWLKYTTFQKLAFSAELSQKGKDNKHQEKIIKSLKDERARNTEKVNLAKKIISLNHQLESDVHALESQIKDRDEYISFLMDIYLRCSDNRDTRAYVSRIIHEQDIALFDPVDYLRSQNYAKVVDMNAKCWIERLDEPDKFAVRADIKKKLRDARKKPIFSSVSTMPMLALEHPFRNTNKDEDSLER